MLLKFLLEGKPEDIQLLAHLVYPGGDSQLVSDSHGRFWLTVSVDPTEHPETAMARVENTLDLASGVLRLLAHAHGRVRFRSVSYFDPRTSEATGLLIDAATVRAPLNPAALLRPTASDQPTGIAALIMAAKNPAVARALSLLASGASEWWEIYILLEILRDNLGKRSARQAGNWEAAFKVLGDRYGHSRIRLKELKQTANYHRHAAVEAPQRPWDRLQAAQFVHTAIRDWIEEILA